MNISILGAGTAIAADLSLRGHDVTLIKTSHSMHNKNFNYLLKNDGKVHLKEKGKTRLAKIKHVTRDLSRLSDSDVIIIYTQTNYHESLIKRIQPYLRDGQILPTVVDSRFISEDVPQGLVLLETLGLECQIDTPICSSLIDIASAAVDRDLRLEGRTVDRLGRKNIKQIFEKTA